MPRGDSRQISYCRTADGWEWEQGVKVELTREQQQRDWAMKNAERVRASKRKYRRTLKGCVDPSGESKHAPCEICGTDGQLHYDHDHETGRFRGWLCNRCNQGLGNFRDSHDLLAKAAAYLTRTSNARAVP